MKPPKQKYIDLRNNVENISTIIQTPMLKKEPGIKKKILNYFNYLAKKVKNGQKLLDY